MNELERQKALIDALVDAALALQQLQKINVVHGRLTKENLMASPDGTVKLVGLNLLDRGTDFQGDEYLAPELY